MLSKVFKVEQINFSAERKAIIKVFDKDGVKLGSHMM